MSTRSLIIAVALLALPGVARAQVTYSKFELVSRDDPTKDWTTMDTLKKRRFFNMATCCGAELGVRLHRSTRPASDDDNVIPEGWAGSGCDTDDTVQRDRDCKKVNTTEFNLLQLFTQERVIELDARSIILANVSGDACMAIETTRKLYLMADTTGDTGFEEVNVFPEDLRIDTRAPGGLSDITTAG